MEPGCTKRYGRRDVFLRHCSTHKASVRYPCPLCQKYDGPQAFKRRDHLQQHMLNYHDIPPTELTPGFCPNNSCSFSQSNAECRVFRTRKEYDSHLREAHGKGTFECAWPGCQRVGKRGYARESDLIKHRQRKHML
ncbi:hypothetical protein BJ546DRAFT_849622 [Cryomyces antarcticus]